MPILAIKDNPPSRFPNSSIQETGLDWFIAKVKPRQEKALAFDLMEMEIGYYLPLYSKSIRRPDTGKLRTSILPLFPSYLPFECSEVPEPILHSNRVLKVMKIRAQDHFKAQLQAVYLARESRLPIIPCDQDAFEMGQLVRICEGPCKGLVGKLVNRINGTSLVIRLEGLGFAGIHVNSQHLAPL